jgi:hypothetical protein
MRESERVQARVRELEAKWPLYENARVKSTFRRYEMEGAPEDAFLRYLEWVDAQRWTHEDEIQALRAEGASEDEIFKHLQDEVEALKAKMRQALAKLRRALAKDRGKPHEPASRAVQKAGRVLLNVGESFSEAMDACNAHFKAQAKIERQHRSAEGKSSG